MPGGRFTLLFASSPKRVEELEPRGVPLLVDLARLVPDLDVVLLWRRWGDVPAARRALAALDPPTNLHVRWADLPDPRTAYWDAHAVVCCFKEGHGKSCPNSLIEAMACGRPVLVTQSCGLADEISAHGGGVIVSDRSAEALAAGILHLRADIARAGADARRAAVAHFDVRTFCRRYQEAYEELRRPAIA
jgi:glycosyltransferase involved in cell wall biosynthesis